MKGYIVISYIKDSLCYNFRKITKEEKKYVNSNSLYKDSLFYSLNYLKKNINKISSTIKNNFNEINYFIVRTTVTFKYVKMLMEKLSCNKLRLLFEYSISIEDYNLLSSIKDLKEIDVYFMPTFIINRFESLNIKVITHYTNKISSKFMLEQDSIDYDTLYYRKKLYITDDYEELEEDIREFFKINYYLKSIDLYCFEKSIIEKLVKLITEDNTKNIIILMHQYSDKGNFIKTNFKYLKDINKKCKENSLCEFRVVYSEDYLRNNLFKQLSYNNLKLMMIMIIYLCASTFIISSSFNAVNSLNADKLKHEIIENENNETKTEPSEDNKNELTDNDIVLDKKEEEKVKKSKYDLENIMDNLLKINNETVGYLVVKNTNISYPVVKHSDNSYYLKRDFYKKKTSMGWVFLDYRNSKDKFDDNNVIYAHSMKNGTMFGTLKKVIESSYRSNSENMIISYDTLFGKYKFKIFSVYKVDYTTDYLKTNFDSEKDFNEFVKLIKSRSVFKSKDKVKYGDKILTLSTCTGNNNRRLVVHAVLIKEEK